MQRILLFILLLPILGRSQTNDSITISKEIDFLLDGSFKDMFDGNHTESLLKARTALQLSLQNKSDFSTAESYYVIGSNYELLRQFDKSISFYKKGIIFIEKTEDKKLRNWFYNNIGNIYCYNLDQYDKGLPNLKKAIFYAEKIDDSLQVYTTSLNLAYLYFYKKDFNKGKPYFEYINKYEKTQSDPVYTVFLNTINGMYYTSTNEDEKAEFHFEKALQLGKNQVNQTEYTYALNEYSNYFFKNENYKKAYELKNTSFEVNNKIMDTILKVNASAVGKSIEIDEYKRKIDEIELQNSLQLQIIDKSRIIAVLLVVSLVIVLLFIYSLFKNNKFRKLKTLELENSNKELQVARDRAEEGSKLKSQFVSTITHELRTPLYGVIGITDMLVDEHKELAESPHLKSLKFSAKYLLSIINDVLQINKIEDNRIVLEQKNFDIGAEMEHIKNSLSFLAKKHFNKIKIDIDPQIPVHLMGDQVRLSQIIMNLTSNALKFTQNGQVVLAAKLIEIKEHIYFVEFTVEDNGVGIAAENQIKVFEKFTQVNKQTIDYQGTGLGLSIVKQLLDLHDSQITLESELGVGAKFTFTIGFKFDSSQSANNSIATTLPIEVDKQLKILVVDDNSINLLITRKTIEKLNFICTTASNGNEALEILETATFDVILMDLNMPILTGFETTAIIRDRGLKTGIIALTAFDKEEVMEEALSSGFDAVISKPYDSKILLELIKSVFVKSQSR